MHDTRCAEALPQLIRLVGWPKLVIFSFDKPEAEEEKKKITSFGQPTSLIVAEPQEPSLVSFICVKLNVSDLQTDMLHRHNKPRHEPSQVPQKLTALSTKKG